MENVSLINNSPYFIWWKVRKYFKLPKISFLYYKLKENHYNLNPILNVEFKGLSYKFNTDKLLYESNPYVSIIFFKKYELLWIFHYSSKHYWVNLITWKAMLDMIIHNKSLKEVFDEYQLKDLNNNSYTIIDNLTKYSKKLIFNNYDTRSF